MKLGLMLPVKPDMQWKLASQLGVKYAVTKAAPELSGLPDPSDFNALKTVRDRFADAGFELYALEGDEFDMTRIKLGLPGRDEDLEKYRRMLTNMGRLGLKLLCYNFMAGTVPAWIFRNAAEPSRAVLTSVKRRISRSAFRLKSSGKTTNISSARSFQRQKRPVSGWDFIPMIRRFRVCSGIRAFSSPPMRTAVR